jgi:hypothetical protein
LLEHEQIVSIELGNGGFQDELLTRRLGALDEVGGKREQHLVASLDRRSDDGG